MDNTVSLTMDQLDTINRSINKAMAVAQILANCGSGTRHEPEQPDATDLFLVMQVVLEEMEKVWEITKTLGDGPK
ncbi:MAG: hypothetical protein HQL67_11560 [Magnetococcales bacterium]|nr:hypothetical protein [Magnetococcales bacterium]